MADSESGGSTAAGVDGSDGSGEGGTSTGVTPTSAAAAAEGVGTTESAVTAPATAAASSPSASAVSTPAAPSAGYPGFSVSSIAGTISDTLRVTVRGITSTFGSGRVPGQHPSGISEELLPEGAVAGEEATEPAAEPAADVAAVVPDTTPPASAAVAELPAPDPGAAAADSTIGPLSDAVPHDEDVLSPRPPTVGNSDKLIGPFQDMLTPMADVFKQAFGVIGPFQDMLTGISRAGALSGVIAPVQSMLTTYSTMYPNVAPYIEPVQYWINWVDTTLFQPLDSGVSWLFGPSWMAPKAVSVGDVDRAAQVPEVSLLAPLTTYSAPQMPADFLRSESELTINNATNVAALGIATSYMARETSVAAESAVTASGPIPLGVQNFFRQAIREIMKSPSLAALTYTALPGVAGILILTAAGIRLGYRQAKAQLAMKAAGIARFAPGQLGVVRSGSFVSVTRRPSRVRRVRPASPASGLATVVVLDRAA